MKRNPLPQKATANNQGFLVKSSLIIMSGSANLANAAINLNLIKEQDKRDLGTILETLKGTKILVVENHLSGPLLGVVTDLATLKKVLT